MFTDNFKYFQITQNANLSNLNCNMYKKHFLDIGIMLSGEMKLIYNDESQIVQKGYVWISDSRDLCKIIDNDNTSKFKIIRISLSFINTIILSNDFFINFSTLFKIPLSVRFSLLSIDDLKSIIHILKIYEELEDQSLFCIQKSLLEMYIITFILSKLDKKKLENSVKKTNYSIQNALELVFTKKEFISTEEAASACAMSTSLFHIEFTTAMKKSFSKFSLNYRINGATHDLLNSDNSLKEISFNWGFKDLSHFYKLFKKKNHCTPIEYKRKYMQEVHLAY